MEILQHKLNSPKIPFDAIYQWINEENIKNPEGRINQYSNMRRNIGLQRTISEIDIFSILFETMRAYGEPTDVWLNFNPPGARNQEHDHVGCHIAGCWYLRVPENSGQLVFETGERFTPEEKDIYFWDSRKLHKVTTNLSKYDRISIAFNLRKF
jgi:hypothetical protein